MAWLLGSCPRLPAPLDSAGAPLKRAGLQLLGHGQTVQGFPKRGEIAHGLPQRHVRRRIPQHLRGIGQPPERVQGGLPVRVEHLQRGLGVLHRLGWGRALAPGTDGSRPLGLPGARRFQADGALPVGVIMGDVLEPLAPLAAEAPQGDVPGVSPVAAIVLAKNMAMVAVCVAPRAAALEHPVELPQGRLAGAQAAPPDERTDATQDDAQVVHHRVSWVVWHAPSVRPNPFGCKGSPRSLAVSPTG
jgi:hypothetical protein